MRRKIYSFLLLICLLLSCNGCQDTKETEKSNVSSQQDDTQKKEKSEVRSSFTTKQAETEEEQETQETKLTEETETESTQEEPGAIAASEDTYDYVALGNSITCNEIEEGLWWGNWGMAASSEEKDYVHLVSNWLGGQSVRPVTTTVLDLKKWEVAQKRDDILADYETYFNEHTDLITIQTGENITDYRDTLTMDYLNLVDFVKKKAPNALILMLGETLWPSELDRTQIRTVLGRFLFTSDDVFKTVDVLSGGEKVRLSLAKLMLRQANFLLLDEPTNHLDIVGKEALEEALNGYTGTILFVSHDRYFIKKIATAILHIDMQGKAVYYPFGYDQFDEDQQEKEKEQAPKKDAEIQRQTPKRNPNAREAAKLEKQIAEKEEQLEELRQKRFDPEYYHDYQKMNELDEQIDDLHNEIEHLMQRWEECLEG